MAFFIKLCLWALAFVPLIVNTSVFFPFIFGKILMIRIFIALASLLFAVHLIANKEFRLATYGRAKQLVKSPIFISTSAFMAIFAVSTFFAVNPFRAFFGDVERGEGLLGFLYFYAFFVYSLFLFEKKDWIWFFKLNLITGFFLFTKQLFELCPTSEAGVTVCNWASRPGAFTGNPAFLGGYFLFVLFAALITSYYTKKELIWRWFAMTMVPVSVVGLFITQTRAAMLGLVMGFLALVVYGALHGKEVIVKRGISLRTVSAWALIAVILIGGIFYATRSNPFWKNVPGFNRAATFTLNDFTVQTRLISLGVSKNAIEPEQNGMQKFLIGWGPENFSVAYNQYYNPDYYHLEHTWFDRAHNKLMDVAVMNGMLGLLVYLGIWIAVGWAVFRKKGFSADMMTVLFFATAFFFNLLFVFDQISTVIPFFAFLAFAVFVATLEDRDDAGVVRETSKKSKGGAENDKSDYAAYGVASVVALLFLWGLIFWTLVPMSQMTNYLTAIREQNVGLIMQQPGAVFEPYTFAQQDIRTHFVSAIASSYGDPKLKPVFDLAIAKMEELIERDPSSPRHLIVLGGLYERMGRIDGNMEYIKRAGGYYQRALELAPMRQDIIYALALNYGYQDRIEDGIALLRKSLETDTASPETHYYLGVLLTNKGDYRESFKELEIMMNSSAAANFKNEITLNSYGYLLKRAYQDRDKELFVAIAKRVELIDKKMGEQVSQVRAYVEKGIWPAVNFK